MSARSGPGLIPALTLTLLAGPVLAGLAGVLLPASGWFPALGGAEFGTGPLRALLAQPGLARSAGLSLFTGLAAPALALSATMLILATLHGTRAFAAVERTISPLLSVPHAAAALGLAFLIAPSGWISRVLSPWMTGWQAPPDLLIVNDRAGLALIAGLALKEIPFLFLISLAALRQAGPRRALAVSETLGYGHAMAWVKVVLPQIYPQIRLPVYAVLAYSVAAVETAMILGPVTPPTLAVRVVSWMRSPDLAQYFLAAAGAVLLLLLTLLALVLWRAGEILLTRLGLGWIENGRRGRAGNRWAVRAGGVAAFLAVAPLLAAIAGLAVWSVAGVWRFPHLLPERFTGRTWMQALPSLGQLAGTSVLIAAVSAGLAMILVLACLESGDRRQQRAGKLALVLLYLPLLVPQVSFLSGLQFLSIAAGLDGRLAGVVLAHLVFVLPYVFLSLSDQWLALDRRYAVSAACLGASPLRVFFAVRLPMMLAPVLTALAVGFAVSVGLYLPTLLIGGGRVATLTTEAVALAAGGDRRLAGAYALAQALAPFAAFALAQAVPVLVWRNRRGMEAQR